MSTALLTHFQQHVALVTLHTERENKLLIMKMDYL
jgi:hypothetical protein